MGIPNEGGFARSDVAGENELRDGEKSRGRSVGHQGESRIEWQGGRSRSGSSCVRLPLLLSWNSVDGLLVVDPSRTYRRSNPNELKSPQDKDPIS